MPPTNLEPDCRVNIVCSGAETHDPCAMGVATWVSGSPDRITIRDTARAEYISESRGAIAYDLQCEVCGRKLTMNLDDWRDRISNAWDQRRGQLDVSRP